MTNSPQPFSPARGNHVIFQDAGEYAKYFEQLRHATDLLLTCYRQQAQSAQDEIHTVARLLELLLTTVETLMLKYSYVAPEKDHLRVDLTESGFPHFMELSALQMDVNLLEDRMRELPPLPILKRNLVDHLIKHKSDPEELLTQIGRRSYYEALAAQKLFFPFTECDLTPCGETKTMRGYLYAWGCYDFESNRPYLHLMAFDQDRRETPLEKGGQNYRDFINVIRQEGTRAPDLGIMALAIDDALERIHPKVLKRICVGPLFSQTILDHAPENHDDPRQEAVRALMGRYSRMPNDLVMFFKDEVVFSVDQRSVRSLLSPAGKIREIFYIPEADPECYESRVSVVHRHIMMPHYLLTSLREEERATIPKFDSTHIFTYDEKGKVYGI